MDGCTLPDGHEGDCVLPPSKLAKANTYAANNTVTKGGITIAASDGGEVVYIDGSGFSLNQTGTYEISGTWDGTETVRNAVITVPDGVTVDITLRGVTIDVSLKSGCCAFAVEPGGTADVTVSGTNSLKSGWDCAGLEVSEDAELTLTSADMAAWRSREGGTVRESEVVIGMEVVSSSVGTSMLRRQVVKMARE
ncbi:MAG: hypothetical protein ACLTC4_12035 [Hungatella hathewayi]